MVGDMGIEDRVAVGLQPFQRTGLVNLHNAGIPTTSADRIAVSLRCIRAGPVGGIFQRLLNRHFPDDRAEAGSRRRVTPVSPPDKRFLERRDLVRADGLPTRRATAQSRPGRWASASGPTQRLYAVELEPDGVGDLGGERGRYTSHVPTRRGAQDAFCSHLLRAVSAVSGSIS
jgi:hypothetical protein